MRAPGLAARLRLPALFLAVGLACVARAQQPPERPPPPDTGLDRATVRKFVTSHCTTCQDGNVKGGGWDLDALTAEDVAAHPLVWEKVARKLAARQMPPAGKPRPEEGACASFVA